MKNILIINPDRLGDVLMNIPMISRLKSNHPKARLTLMCQPAVAQMLRCCKSIDAFELIDFGRIPDSTAKRDLLGKLRTQKFDCAIMPAPLKWAHVMMFKLGVKYRIGFNCKWGCFLNDKIDYSKDQATQHEINYNLELLDRVCSQKWDGTIDLGYQQHPDYQNILQKYKLADEKKIIAFHMTTSNPAKKWSLEKFKEVIKRLLDENKYKIILVGAEDLDDVSSVVDFPQNEWFGNLIGKTPIDELGVVLNKVDCLVSLDSGPYHMAWMQKTPVVGIFNADAVGSTLVRWGVYPEFDCRNKQIYKPADQISVDEVHQAVKKLC